MARLNFLAVTDVSSWSPIVGSQGAFLADHAHVRNVLIDVSADLADLFAEPVYKRQSSGKIDTVTWYTKAQGAIKKLNHLEPDIRDNILADLKKKVSKCGELLDRQDIGENLAAMLSLGDADSVMVVGRTPVLINWGLINPAFTNPESETVNANALWQELFGEREFSVVPVTTKSDATPSAKNGEPSSGRRYPSDSALVSEHQDRNSPKPSGHGSQRLPVIALDKEQVEEGIEAQYEVDTDQGIYGAEIASEKFADARFTEDHEPAVPDAKDDGYQGSKWWQYFILWSGWVAFGLLLLFLLFMLWWHFGGSAWWEQHQSGAEIDALAAERDLLLQLIEEPCSPEAQDYLQENVLQGGPSVEESGAVAQNQVDNSSSLAEEDDLGRQSSDVQDLPVSDEEGLARTETLPEKAEAETGSSTVKSMTELAKSAERSIVLILTASQNGGVNMGSGFFVAPDLIVTNRHVVEGSPDSTALITSAWLGDIQRAKVVAMSADAEIGNPDFALLRLPTSSKGVPLPVSNTVDKLMKVVAAGYPAFLTQGDPALQRLMAGDRNSAPEMVFTTGEVSVVQKHDNKPDIIIHSADISQGNSGGPLMNACGEVVGVNTFVGQDAQSGRRGLFSISGADLQKFLKKNNANFQEISDNCGSATGE